MSSFWKISERHIITNKSFYFDYIKEVQPIITSNHSNYNMRFKNGFALIPASINEMTSTLPLEKKCALSRRLRASLLN